MKPFIIAEVSANHLGDLGRARNLVMAAAASGADAVKFQCWTPGTMCIDPNYRVQGGLWDGQRLMDLYAEAYTPWEWFPELFELAEQLGILAFSSVFDEGALGYLEGISCPMYKISSFELVDLPLIYAVAKTGKAMIMSTGMATHAEIADALETARVGGCDNLAILKCTSAYPTPYTDCNLATITHMATSFSEYDLAIGVSDHTNGITVPIAATAMGAAIIEKHLTLSRADGGPDAEFSLEPDEFKQMVQEVINAAEAIGKPHYGPLPGESTQLRRSLYISRDLSKGHLLGREDMVSARPSSGCHSAKVAAFLGKELNRDCLAGTPMTEDLV